MKWEASGNLEGMSLADLSLLATWIRALGLGGLGPFLPFTSRGTVTKLPGLWKLVPSDVKW
jgi:hypothetical protein